MFRKILLWLLAIFVILLVISVIFIKNNKPVYSGTISLDTLEENVTVYLMRMGFLTFLLTQKKMPTKCWDMFMHRIVYGKWN